MEDAKTCIICGKEFSPYVRHCHGLQLSKTKTTCSDKCRAVANAQLKRERYQAMKEKAQDGTATHEKRHNLKKVYCLAICPYCGKTHDVLLDRKPMILPRIYCRAHEWCRDEDDEMIGGVTMRRGQCPRWPNDWIYKDYCVRCPERKGCINKGGIHGKEH